MNRMQSIAVVGVSWHIKVILRQNINWGHRKATNKERILIMENLNLNPNVPLLSIHTFYKIFYHWTLIFNVTIAQWIYKTLPFSFTEISWSLVCTAGQRRKQRLCLSYIWWSEMRGRGRLRCKVNKQQSSRTIKPTRNCVSALCYAYLSSYSVTEMISEHLDFVSASLLAPHTGLRWEGERPRQRRRPRLQFAGNIPSSGSLGQSRALLGPHSRHFTRQLFWLLYWNFNP